MKRKQTQGVAARSFQRSRAQRGGRDREAEVRRQEQRLRATLGKAARVARLRSGLTQADVADTIGTVTEVYGRMERGKLLPSVPTLFRLCLALHSGPHELMGFTPVERGSVKPPWGGLRVPRGVTDTPEIRRLVRRLGGLDPSKIRLIQLIVAALVARPLKRRGRQPPG